SGASTADPQSASGPLVAAMIPCPPSHSAAYPANGMVNHRRCRTKMAGVSSASAGAVSLGRVTIEPSAPNALITRVTGAALPAGVNRTTSPRCSDPTSTGAKIASVPGRRAGLSALAAVYSTPNARDVAAVLTPTTSANVAVSASTTLTRRAVRRAVACNVGSVSRHRLAEAEAPVGNGDAVTTYPPVTSSAGPAESNRRLPRRSSPLVYDKYHVQPCRRTTAHRRGVRTPARAGGWLLHGTRRR